MTYSEWLEAALALELTSNRRRKKDGDLFDEELVRHRLRQLRDRRKEGSLQSIMFHLRTDLVRNLGGICNSELHQGRVQMPQVIQEYIDEAKIHLHMVVESQQEGLPLEERLAFVHEVRHAFGRTALLLSGGAALGSFHLGVVRTLIEHNLLPRVVAGASVGSIICSFTATRTWPQLLRFFDEAMPSMNFFDTMGSIFVSAHRLLTKGAVHEIGQLQRKMRELIGDLTFQEAYEISGRVLGIAVCSPRKHEPPRLLNYLSSPHVVIWSAVAASCAFPGLFEAQDILAKDSTGKIVPYFEAKLGSGGEPVLSRQWRDGSLESDLPMTQLKELFNVNHFIVSQANPHIAPFLRLKGALRHYFGDFAAKLANVAEMEVKHRCNQLLQLGMNLGGIAKLFAQDWEGDITIVMPATLAQFAKLIQNPTTSELRKAVLQGKRCTWAKLPAIYTNCGIEQTLDECVSELSRRRRLYREQMLKQLREQNNGDEEEEEEEDVRKVERASASRRETRSRKKLGASGSFSNGRRIPSWNCLQRECSWGSLEDGCDSSASLTTDMATTIRRHGAWAYPAVQRLRGPLASSDAEDGEGGGNSGRQSPGPGGGSAAPPVVSWTVSGGPLMRTPSALQLAMAYGTMAEPLPPGPEAGASSPETSTSTGDGAPERSLSSGALDRDFLPSDGEGGTPPAAFGGRDVLAPRVTLSATVGVPGPGGGGAAGSMEMGPRRERRIRGPGKFGWSKLAGYGGKGDAVVVDDSGSYTEDNDAAERSVGLALWNGSVSPNGVGTSGGLGGGQLGAACGGTMQSLPEGSSVVDSPVVVTRPDGGKRRRRTVSSGCEPGDLEGVLLDGEDKGK